MAKTKCLTLDAVLGNDEFADLGGVVAEAMKRHQDQAKQRFADLLVGTLGEVDDSVRGAVRNLRAIRKQEAVQLALVSKLSKAADHLKKTGNPLPFFKASGQEYQAAEFCRKIGVPVPDADDKLWNCGE